MRINKKIKKEELPKIFIARHCNTIYNLENRIQGSLDIPLSENGKEEALSNLQRIRKLKLEKIFSSPLKRAWETALIYSKNLKLPIYIDDRLRELNHGLWEGERVDKLISQTNSSYEQWLRDPANIEIPGGTETIYSAQERIMMCIVDLLLRNQSENILVITHKHIKALLCCGLLNHDLNSFRSYIKNGIEPEEIPQNLLKNLKR